MSLRHSTLQPRATRVRVSHMSGLANQSDSPSQKPLSLSMPPSPTDTDDDEALPASMRVGLVVHRSSAGLVGRANDLLTLLDLNRHVRIPPLYALEMHV